MENNADRRRHLARLSGKSRRQAKLAAESVLPATFWGSGSDLFHLAEWRRPENLYGCQLRGTSCAVAWHPFSRKDRPEPWPKRRGYRLTDGHLDAIWTTLMPCSGRDRF